jgi:hypothetical protein
MKIAIIILVSAFYLYIFFTLLGACILGTLMDRRLRGEK